LLVNNYLNKNDHRESGLYNCFHEKNREIIFSVMHTDGMFYQIPIKFF
ncbi:MAG: hypothetical protein ACI9VN_003626, partial [Patescibacteria group bacterium]